MLQKDTNERETFGRRAVSALLDSSMPRDRQERGTSGACSLLLPRREGRLVLGDARARGRGGGGSISAGRAGQQPPRGAWGGAGPLCEGGELWAAGKQSKAMNGTARPERTASKALSSLGTAWQGREASRALEVLQFLLAALLKPRAETKRLSAYFFIFIFVILSSW